MQYVALHHSQHGLKPICSYVIYVVGVTSLARGCPHLQVVYLRRCVNITDESIVALAQCCPRLRDLNVGGCPRLTDDSLIALGQHSASLCSIDFTSANVC